MCTYFVLNKYYYIIILYGGSHASDILHVLMGVSVAKLIIYNIVLLFICHNKRSSSSSYKPIGQDMCRCSAQPTKIFTEPILSSLSPGQVSRLDCHRPVCGLPIRRYSDDEDLFTFGVYTLNRRMSV